MERSVDILAEYALLANQLLAPPGDPLSRLGVVAQLQRIVESMQITTPPSPVLPAPVGNWQPIETCISRQVYLTKALPSDLDGAFIMMAPNLRFQTSAPGDKTLPRMVQEHRFDGDGMVHAFIVQQNGTQAFYVNDYVMTSRLEQELHFQAPMFVRAGGIYDAESYLFALLRMVAAAVVYKLDMGHGAMTANTSPWWCGGKLYALHELDLPYQLNIIKSETGLPKIITVGRALEDKSFVQAFSAHPKMHSSGVISVTYEPLMATLEGLMKRLKDTGWGRALAQLLPDPAPEHKSRFTVSIFDKDLDAKPANITIPFNDERERPIMSHDFVVTSTSAVVLEVPLVFDWDKLSEKVKETVKYPMGYSFDEKKPLQFAVVPLDPHHHHVDWYTAKYDDTSEDFCRIMLHLVDVREAKGIGQPTKLYGLAYEKFDLGIYDNEPPQLWEFTFERSQPINIARARLVGKGAGKDGKDDLICGEFPTKAEVPGGTARYVYISTFAEDKRDLFSGFIKVDMDGGPCVVHNIIYEHQQYGGQVAFVPRARGNQDVAVDASDDGYLLTFVYEVKEHVSFLLVYDAHTCERIHKVRLPQRVPYGFHCIHVPQMNLKLPRFGLY